MGRTSSISKHPKRKEIDKALVLPGASIRGIARTYRVSEDALSRYVKGGNIEQKVKQAQQAQDIVEADDLLKEIQEIQEHQKTIFKEARDRVIETEEGRIKKPDNKLALEALRDQSKIIELKGKVLGSFVKDTTKTPGASPGAAIVTPLPPEAARKIGDIIAGNI